VITVRCSTASATSWPPAPCGGHPERYGSWKTCRERLRRWQADGTWDRFLGEVQVHDDGEPVEWTVHMDSTAFALRLDIGLPFRLQMRCASGD
jgi:hypothetical protein